MYSWLQSDSLEGLINLNKRTLFHCPKLNKTMKNLTLILAFIGIWNSVVAQNDYFPLKKGTKITYAYSEEMYSGQNIDVSKLKMTIKVLDETKVIDGNNYMISETSMGAMAGNIKTFLRIDESGAIVGKQGEEGKESILMKKELEVGDSWETNRGGAVSTNKVIDLAGTIKTPLKTYTDCLVVEGNDSRSVTKAYFKKGIGMVAIVIVAGDAEKLFVYLEKQE